MINILGTEYEYDETTDRKDARLCNNDGYCDAYQRRIAIEVEHNELDPPGRAHS